VEAGQGRRHADVPAATVPGSKGKEGWEEEETAAKLTARSIWTEEGRERELDGGGEAPVERQW
jgi:hypothetical protein